MRHIITQRKNLDLSAVCNVQYVNGLLYFLSPFLTDDFPATEGQYYQLLLAYVGRFEPQFFPSLRWNDSAFENETAPRHVEVRSN